MGSLRIHDTRVWVCVCVCVCVCVHRCIGVYEIALTSGGEGGGETSLAHLLLILENTIPGSTATVNLYDESMRF